MDEKSTYSDAIAVAGALAVIALLLVIDVLGSIYEVGEL